MPKTHWNVGGVHIVRSVIIVGRFQLHPRVIIGQDVGEPILGPVRGQIGRHAALAQTDGAQILREIRVILKPKF